MSKDASSYFDVSSLPEPQVVKIVRTSEPFPRGSSTLDPMFAEAHSVADSVDRSRWGLLLDLRNTVGRNDPDFEKLIAPHRAKLEHGFRKVAVVVRSQVGRLQVERHARDDGVNLRVFLEEDEALAWLGEREG